LDRKLNKKKGNKDLEIKMKEPKDVAELLFKIEIECSLKTPRDGLYYAVSRNIYDAEVEGYSLRIYSEVNEENLACIKSMIQERKLKCRWITDKSQRVLEVYTPRKI
jgi:hypothetical protein